MKHKAILVACLMACLLAGPVFGAVVGKITGTITDVSTNEPLVGVSVSIQGTTMGGKTDVDGRYIILNVPVGDYTLVVSSVGYATVEVSNVHVSPDLATFQDVDMTSEVTDLGKVIEVRAERPLVIKDKTTSVNIIEAEEIQALPIRRFEDVVGLQNSVVRMKTNVDVRQRGFREENAQSAEINLRGGRPSEVAYYIDGFSQQDPLTGNSTTTIAQNAIKEISVTSGVFSAEYGHVASGVVNVVTKSGTNEYHANVDVLTDNKPGADTYDQNYYSADFSGPLPGLSKSYFFVSGERRWLADRSPSIKTKEIVEEFGYDIPYPHRFRNNSASGWSGQGKLDFEVTPNVKLQLNGNYSIDDWHEYLHGYFFNWEHNIRRVDQNLGINGKVTHAINPETFYNLSVSYFKTERERGDGEVFDDVAGYDRPWITSYGEEYGNPEWDDLDLFRESAYEITDVDSNIVGTAGSLNDRYIHRISSYIGVKGDFNKQAFNHHTLKLGFDFQRHTLRLYDYRNPSKINQPISLNLNRFGFDEEGNTSDDEGFENETKHPINIGLYLNDRFDWRGLIISAGIRFDYFDYRTLGIRDLSAPFALGPEVDSLDIEDMEDSEAFKRLSPRIGIGFPVSDKTQFHINYGIFYQRPDLQNLFVGYDFFEARVTAGSYLPFASPNLEPETITQYEAGITHQLGNNTAFGVTAYYKDVEDQTQIFHQGAIPTAYDYYDNTDYGTVKGIDFNITMRRLRNMSLNLNYTLSWATGTGSYAQTQYNVAWKAPENPPKTTNPLDYDQRHSVTGVIDFRTTKGEGPRFGDIYPLEDFGLNVLISASSGTPYTPTLRYDGAREGIAVWQQPTGRINSANLPWTFQVDLKAERKISIAQFSFTPYVWVKNLFENENVYLVYEGTGEPDVTGWLETGEGEGWAEANGPDAVALYQFKENNPKNYGEPRIIYFGMRMSF